MPWRTSDVLEERFAFVTQAKREEMPFTALCRLFGMSRDRGYTWCERFAAEGVDGLKDRSRAPHRHPQAAPADIVDAVLAVRQRHPRWGPRKVLAWLEQHAPPQPWPVASTIGAWFDAAGLTVPRRRRARVPPRSAPFADCAAPNAVWCADFKGWFRTGDGARCEPFTLSDAHSRYLLRCQAVARTDHATVWPIIEAAFYEYGLPWALRTDNGPPFASCGVGGLSRLAVSLIKAGVVPERIDPGAPQQNGRHERLHLTLAQETASPAAASLRAQARRFAAFRRLYNEERPHEALGQTPPAAHYGAAPRRYTGRLRSPDYAEDCHVRQVRHCGEIKWRGAHLYIGQVLAGEPVGLAPIGDGVWRVVYGPVELGTLDHRGCLRRPKRRARTRRPPCGIGDNANALPPIPQGQQPPPTDGNSL